MTQKLRFRDRLALAFGLKAMPFYPRDEMYLNGLLPRSNYNFGHDIKEGLDSNVLMAPVRYMMRTFTEAHAAVQSRRATGAWGKVEDHPLEMLVESPNEFYDGDSLWQATIISYVLDGNAYWLKIRNQFGEVRQLWYAPHWMVTPKRPYDDPSVFISHYEYTPGGETIKLSPDDVVHFRFGLDPRDTRKGLGCLRPLLREVFSDEEAASFSAAILTNMGVPGLVVSPKAPITGKENVTMFREMIDAATTGDNRGSTFVPNLPVDVIQFGFDPNKLMLANLRDITEERVCAMLGIPAAVVGFGSGLQSTKVGATMRELRQSAWTECLIPMQKSMAKKLTANLLPDFVAQRRQFRVRFDMTEVSAFAEETDAVAARAERLVLAGILRVDRAQEMCGLEVDPKREIYLEPTAARPLDKAGKPIEVPQPSQNGNGADGDVPEAVASRMNGNGSKPTDEE